MQRGFLHAVLCAALMTLLACGLIWQVQRLAQPERPREVSDSDLMGSTDDPPAGVVSRWVEQLTQGTSSTRQAPLALAAAGPDLAVADPHLQKLTKWIEEQRAKNARFTELFQPSYPLDTGVVGRIDLYASSRDGSAQYTMHDALVSASAAERVFARAPPSAYASTRTTRVQVTARVDPTRRWMSAEAFVELEKNASSTALLDFPIGRITKAHGGPQIYHQLADYDRGVLFSIAGADGIPCPFSIADGQVAVGVGRNSSLQRLRFRYEGDPAQEHSYFRRNHAYLRSWFPVSVNSSPAMELTLIVPATHHVLGLGTPRQTATSADGWTSSTWHLPAGAAEPVAVVLPRPPTGESAEVLRVGEVSFHLHGKPDAQLRAALREAHAALDPLGLPWPARMDVVLADQDAAGDGAIFLADDQLFRHDPSARIGAVTNLLAQQWFGRQVADLPDGAAGAASSISRYLELASLPEAVRHDLLRYAVISSSLSDPTPLSYPAVERRAPFDRQLARGARILLSLAARIGEPKLASILRDVHAANRGRALSWPMLIAAVKLGSDEATAAWLAAWANAAEPASFSLHKLGREKTRRRIVLRAPAPQARGLVIPVVFYRGERELQRLAPAILEEDGVTDPIEIPDGADRWVIDPEWTTPLHFEIDEAARAPRQSFELSTEWPS